MPTAIARQVWVKFVLALRRFSLVLTRIRETKTVTQVKAYWMEPTRKQVKAAPVTNVDFSSAAMKKKLLDAAIDGTEPRQQQKDRD